MELKPGAIVNWDQQGNRIDIETENQVRLQINILSDKIIRFRYGTDGHFARDFSYSVESDLSLIGEFLRFREGKTHLTLTTAFLVCKIDRATLQIQITDRAGNIICEDDKGYSYGKDLEGGPIVKMSKVSPTGEQYYGLGDKSSYLFMRGKRVQNWCTDSFGFNGNSDPLYKSIPFYYALKKNGAYGIFLDNTFSSFFDFAAESPGTTSFWATGGEMNYYFVYGPSLISVAEQYTLLTGRPELPPLWALGYHQSKWGYESENKVREIALEFRRRKIPCDALYLDIDHMDNYKSFTWNEKNFPNPGKMIHDLSSQGFHTVAIVNPGIRIDRSYDLYQEGLLYDLFCKSTDGPYVKGSVWPGLCLFPDFTLPSARKWWANHFKEMIRKYGVAGIWNDMNEPAIFDLKGRTLPLDTRHDFDGNPCSHRKAHNIYGMQMTRASYEGAKEFSYPNRPFVLTRATFAGGQRYSAVWTGDNNSSWEHLRLAIFQVQRLSISGFSFAGADIGGFNLTCSGELLVRWLQTGIFQPFCRNHSKGINEPDNTSVKPAPTDPQIDEMNQEPWAFGEPYETLCKNIIEFRYKILPCLYTAFWQYVTKGTPVIRPLVFIDQDDTETYTRMEEFCLGDHLLVCPIIEPQVQGRKMYLPKGRWYNFYSDEATEGGKEFWAAAGLDKIPIFIRAGAVIPMYPVMQYVGEKRVDELTLHIYHTQTQAVESYLYEDAGEGYEYTQGHYLLRRFIVTGNAMGITLSQIITGKYKPTYILCRLYFHGLPFSPKTIGINGEFQELTTGAWKNHTLQIEIISNFKEIRIG